MKSSVVATSVLAFVLAYASTVNAQPFAFVDASANAHNATLGVGGSYFFMRGHRFQPGIAINAFHPFDLNAAAPDIEMYGALSIGLNNDTFLLVHLGAGATWMGDDVSWSARVFLVLTQSTNVGPMATVFFMLTQEGNAFVLARIGPNIQLGQTNWRLFPHIGIGITAPTVDAQLEAGVSLLWTPP